MKVDIACPGHVPSGRYETDVKTVNSLQSSIISGRLLTRLSPHSAYTVSELTTICGGVLSVTVIV